MKSQHGAAKKSDLPSLRMPAYSSLKSPFLSLFKHMTMSSSASGAEPAKEVGTAKCFLAGLISLYSSFDIKVTMIGPLLMNPPELLEHDPDLPLRIFGGTYQEYLGSRYYKRPDLIAAFYPGKQLILYCDVLLYCV